MFTTPAVDVVYLASLSGDRPLRPVKSRVRAYPSRGELPAVALAEETRRRARGRSALSSRSRATPCSRRPTARGSSARFGKARVHVSNRSLQERDDEHAHFLLPSSFASSATTLIWCSTRWPAQQPRATRSLSAPAATRSTTGRFLCGLSARIAAHRHGVRARVASPDEPRPAPHRPAPLPRWACSAWPAPPLLAALERAPHGLDSARSSPACRLASIRRAAASPSRQDLPRELHRLAERPRAPRMRRRPRTPRYCSSVAASSQQQLVMHNSLPPRHREGARAMHLADASGRRDGGAPEGSEVGPPPLGRGRDRVSLEISARSRRRREPPARVRHTRSGVDLRVAQQHAG